MHICKQLGFEIEEADAMMALEAAYCELDATKAEYAKLVKCAKQKEKDSKDKGETPAPEGKNKRTKGTG